MNTVMSFIKWSIGFIFGIFLFFLFSIVMSLSLVATQLLNATTALQWINAGTSRPVAMEELRERILGTMASSENTTDGVDPGSQAILKAMGDASSPLGKDTRIVFSSEVIGKNIEVNAQAFYSWLNGTGDDVLFTVYFDGTTQQKESFLANFLKTRYEALPLCSTELVEEVRSVENSSLFTIPCQVETVSASTYAEQAKIFLSDPEIVRYVDGGIPVSQKISSQRRIEIKAVGRMASIVTVLCWGFSIGLLVLMVFLMSPLPAGMIVAGGTAVSIGFIFIGMWSSIFNSVGMTAGTATFYTQGGALVTIGAALIIGGIVLLARKKSNTFPIDGEVKKRPAAI